MDYRDSYVLNPFYDWFMFTTAGVRINNKPTFYRDLNLKSFNNSDIKTYYNSLLGLIRLIHSKLPRPTKKLSFRLCEKNKNLQNLWNFPAPKAAANNVKHKCYIFVLFD